MLQSRNCSSRTPEHHCVERKDLLRSTRNGIRKSGSSYQSTFCYRSWKKTTKRIWIYHRNEPAFCSIECLNVKTNKNVIATSNGEHFDIDSIRNPMYGTLGRSLCLKAPVRTRLARFSCAIHFPCSNFPIDRPQTKDRRRFSKSINESHLSPSFSRTWKIRMAMTTNAASEKNVLVPIAQGTEEMEAVIIIDVLRRAGAKAETRSFQCSS